MNEVSVVRSTPHRRKTSWESPYMDFDQVYEGERVESIHFATPVYDIKSKKDGSILGEIKWYPKWRQFCLFTKEGVLFNKSCLGSIEAFIQRLKEHKEEDDEREKDQRERLARLSIPDAKGQEGVARGETTWRD